MQLCLKFIAVLFISIAIEGLAYAQKTAEKTAQKKDSTLMYKNIETYSKQNKYTKFIHRLIFKPVAVAKKKPKKNVYKKLIQKPYSTFEGKTIRNIDITTLDPFGYSLTEKDATAKDILSIAGNKLHIKSLNITIRNLLLIRRNQTFDSLLVKESERLIRNRSFLKDVTFYTVATAKNSDSVDIFIRVMDRWSIIPQASSSSSYTNITLTDENFLGLGHEFKNSFTWFPTATKNAFNVNYYISNIRNSYISTTLNYGTNESGNFNKNFEVDRPFFSPFAKWAAGINLKQQFYKDSVRSNNLSPVFQGFRVNSQDFWLGSAIHFLRGNNEDSRSTSFISTVRYLQIHFLEKPSQAYDTLRYFTDEKFYFLGSAISTRKYVQDKYIFKYGTIEDVPIGKIIGFTGGYQIKNNIGRLYLGMRIAFGYYFTWGYLSPNVEFGTFLRGSKSEQGVFSAGVNYFTGLFEVGKFKFRQFVKPEFTLGLNRTLRDSISLNDGYGIDGFNSSQLAGTNRMLLTLQTQSYTPWKVIGFRFSPFFICSLGMLGNTSTGFSNSKIYSQIGIGVLIKNDNLVLNQFQISLSFYPHIPGNGYNIIKIGSFKTSDFGFRDFGFGKPDVTIYQ